MNKLKQNDKAKQEERKQRAFNQPIYLLKMLDEESTDTCRKFYVTGTTGNKYTVTISNNISCSCPDNSHNKKVCKHLYFVMLRIMKTMDVKSAYTDEELVDMFKKIPTHIDPKLRAEIIDNIVHKLNVQQKFDDDCPICLELIVKSEPDVNFCKQSCGKSFHNKCWDVWFQSSKVKSKCCLFCASKLF